VLFPQYNFLRQKGHSKLLMIANGQLESLSREIKRREVFSLNFFSKINQYRIMVSSSIEMSHQKYLSIKIHNEFTERKILI
jgi:hypothetical protein